MSQRSNPRQKKKSKKKKQQHSLDHLKERVSELMAIFETNGWFLLMPNTTDIMSKVQSNRNYGADKKRQRKHRERLLLEARILQLETVLQHDHPEWLDEENPSSDEEEEA